MSGVLIVDGRHATGRAGMVLRRAFAQGGVTDPDFRRGQLATLFPVDSLRVADLALVRTGDREWYVVKDRHGPGRRTIGPEEVSEILAVERRQELGLPAEFYDLTTGEPLHFFDRERIREAQARAAAAHLMQADAATAYLTQEIRGGRVHPDGADMTVHIKPVEDHGAVIMLGADVKFTAVTGLPLPVPHVTILGGPDPIDRGEIKRAPREQKKRRNA